MLSHLKEPSYETAFRLGDPQTFTSVFHLFYKRLLCFAGGMLPAREAEDAVQEAFVKLWERRKNFEALQAVKAFLFLSVKNSCLNTIKHQEVVHRHGKLLHVAEEEQSVLSRMIEAETIHEMLNALGSLPPGCRNILHQGYFEGLSNQEVADKLYVSINTVKTQKVRGLRLLRSSLFKKWTTARIAV